MRAVSLNACDARILAFVPSGREATCSSKLVALRAVGIVDVTAHWARLPYEFLENDFESHATFRRA
jgi:hypothetical protein